MLASHSLCTAWNGNSFRLYRPSIWIVCLLHPPQIPYSLSDRARTEDVSSSLWSGRSSHQSAIRVPAARPWLRRRLQSETAVASPYEVPNYKPTNLAILNLKKARGLATLPLPKIVLPLSDAIRNRKRCSRTAWR